MARGDVLPHYFMKNKQIQDLELIPCCVVELSSCSLEFPSATIKLNTKKPKNFRSA